MYDIPACYMPPAGKLKDPNSCSSRIPGCRLRTRTTPFSEKPRVGWDWPWLLRPRESSRACAWSSVSFREGEDCRRGRGLFPSSDIFTCYRKKSRGLADWATLWGCGVLWNADCSMGSSEQINKILIAQGASRGFGKSDREDDVYTR